MVSLSMLVQFLDAYLETDRIKDDSWNGLQVEGVPEVKKVLCAVDAGVETFEYAIQEKVDLVVVHHGLFWKSANPSVRAWTKKRIVMLYEHGISVYASHLPLDRHPEVGNNVQLLRLLGFEKEHEFGWYGGQTISFTGRSENPKRLSNLEDLLQKELGATCVTLPFGAEAISTMAVCSGGGGYPQFMEAVHVGVDLYVTGDSTEMYHMAKDIGINVIFAGHHATETVGVKALAGLIKEKFGIEAIFADIPTGL